MMEKSWPFRLAFFVFLIAMLPLISFATAGVNYNAYAKLQRIRVWSRWGYQNCREPADPSPRNNDECKDNKLRWVFVKIGVANNQARKQSIIFDENNRVINFAKSDYSWQLSQCASGNGRMPFGYRLTIKWERHKWALKYKLSILLNGLQRSSSSLVMEWPG